VFAPSRHLHSDCRLAVFNQISIRHLVRPPFGHTGEERFEAWPHLPELTKGQRLDAPYLRKPLLPWSMGAVYNKGVTVQLRRLFRHQLDDVER
jgi:hypothetical protein